MRGKAWGDFAQGHRLRKLNAENGKSKRKIPSTAKAFGSKAAFDGGIGLKQSQNHFAQYVENHSGMTHPNMRVILSKGNIQNPMQIVFNRPVCPLKAQKRLCVECGLAI